MKRRWLTMVDVRYLLRAVRLVWDSGPALLLVSGAIVLLQGALPVVPIYVVKMIVEAVTAGEPFSRILPLIIAVGAAILLTALLHTVGNYVREAQSLALSDYVQGLIHEKSLDLDLGYYEGAQFYDRLHHAQQQAPVRPAQVVDTLMSIVRSGISVIGIAGVLIVALPWYAVTLLGLSAIPPAIVRLVASGKMYSWRMKRTATERRVHYLNWLITSRQIAKEVRVFRLGELLKGRSKESRDQLREERLSMVRRRSVGELCAAGAQAAVVAGLLVYFAYDSVAGAGSLGNLVLFFQATQKGQQVLGELFNAMARLYETNLFLASAFEFLQLEPSLATMPPGAPSGGCQRGLDVEHVTFRYPNSERPVLDDVSLHVGHGEVVAVVGDNGAGKTTLIKLLCRFYDPESGTIRMDGHDLRTIPDAELRGSMAVLFQDFAQYFYSAHDNIWFGDVSQERDGDRVTTAARRAQADSFLSTLPDGYRTVLGRWLEEGAELSGGQWKKVALARTLYRDAPLVILDEPTAGMDPDSEARFIDDLRSLAKDRSLLIVSHKIASARQADRVYVMRDGRVIEHGTNDELLAANGFYAGLYRTQLRQIQSGAKA